MKFGKSLSNQIVETLPEWKDQFLSYKDLKRHLKLMIGPTGGEKNKRLRLSDDAMTSEENAFICLLEAEIDKFNTFFVDKEEGYIIRHQVLQDRAVMARDSYVELMKIGKEIVDFHGEMVLLENYSALNYTGIVKILKKYDKRTGALIRQPFIQKVLQEPFFTTDLLNKLVKECEALIDLLFPASEPSAYGEGVQSHELVSATEEDGLLRLPMELAEIEYMKSLYMKSTLAALRALKEIRSGSSTVSEFSLPPLQMNSFEEDWFKIPVIEQAAK